MIKEIMCSTVAAIKKAQREHGDYLGNSLVIRIICSVCDPPTPIALTERRIVVGGAFYCWAHYQHLVRSRLGGKDSTEAELLARLIFTPNLNLYRERSDEGGAHGAGV